MKRRLPSLLAGLLLLVPAAAAAAKEPVNWGALAFGPGAYGWAVNARNEAEAEAAAQANCGGSCTESFTFHDSCGAIATADGEAYWGGGSSQSAAEREAMEVCGMQWSELCELAVWACTK